MKVRVLFFGPLTDVTGCSKKVYRDQRNTGCLQSTLFEEYPALKSQHFRWAVNQELINEKVSLSNGDEVALLPPYAGG